MNGSGKHNNWGLNTDSGRNLFVPGKNDKDQASFIAMVACLARALHIHGDVIRCGVATASAIINKLRWATRIGCLELGESLGCGTPLLSK